MALIKCPECGRENVSSQASSCPECGFNLYEYSVKLEQEETARIMAAERAQEEAKKQQELYEAQQRKMAEEAEAHQRELDSIALPDSYGRTEDFLIKLVVLIVITVGCICIHPAFGFIIFVILVILIAFDLNKKHNRYLMVMNDIVTYKESELAKLKSKNITPTRQVDQNINSNNQVTSQINNQYSNQPGAPTIVINQQAVQDDGKKEANSILILGIISMFCCFPCGIGGIISYMVNIGKIDYKHKGTATLGLILCMISLGIIIIGMISSFNK